MNNPLKYADPSGMNLLPIDQGWELDEYFDWQTNRLGFLGGCGGGGGWGGVIGADQDYVATVLYDSNVKFYGSYDYAKTGAYISNYDGHIESYAEYYANKITPDLKQAKTKFVSDKISKAIAQEVSYNVAGLAAGVVFGIPCSDEGLFNSLAAVKYLLSIATPYYDAIKNGNCAAAVFKALGFANLCGKSQDAYLAGPLIMRLGFMPLANLSGYSPLLCDITIFDRNSSHRSGHMEMWCGSELVSDFRQGSYGFYPCFVAGGPGFSPYPSDTPSFTIYRRPWWLGNQ